MTTVQKAGEKFTFQSSVFTAKSFSGATDKEYPTASEAKKANPKDKMIYVKNVEHGGVTELALSIKK